MARFSSLLVAVALAVPLLAAAEPARHSSSLVARSFGRDRALDFEARDFENDYLERRSKSSTADYASKKDLESLKKSLKTVTEEEAKLKKGQEALKKELKKDVKGGAKAEEKDKKMIAQIAAKVEKKTGKEMAALKKKVEKMEKELEALKKASGGKVSTVTKDAKASKDPKKKTRRSLEDLD